MTYILGESKISDKLDKLDFNQNVSNANCGWFGSSFHTDLSVSRIDIQEKQLIKKYRQYSDLAKVDEAIMNIVNEAVVIDEGDSIVLIPDGINHENQTTERKWKENLPFKFLQVLKMLDWNKYGDDYFRRWYEDGRLYVYFETKKKEGIVYTKVLDPLRLSIKIDKNEKYYYEYNINEKFFESDYIQESATKDDIQILPFDNVLFIPSGLTKNGMVISYLNKAIRPINLLQMMENSMVVYRFVRAPERWVFKIDVGGMSRANAEAYMSELQRNYRQKFSMDTITGEVSSENSVMSMMENFWFPKTRSQNQGHDIDTIGGSMDGISNIDDVLYFQKEMYKSLHVPISRLEPENSVVFGSRTEEIGRDELNFYKFIKYLRRRFNILFIELLKTHVIESGMATEDQWNDIEDDIKFRYANDNIYEMAKEKSILESRLELVSSYEQYLLKYYGPVYIKKTILKQSDEDMKEYQKDIDEYSKNNNDNENGDF